MFTKVIVLFKNCPAKLPIFPENVHQGYRFFQKLSGKVTDLSGKCSPRLSFFSKIVRQGYRSFRKKSGSAAKNSKKTKCGIYSQEGKIYRNTATAITVVHNPFLSPCADWQACFVLMIFPLVL